MSSARPAEILHPEAARHRHSLLRRAHFEARRRGLDEAEACAAADDAVLALHNDLRAGQPIADPLPYLHGIFDKKLGDVQRTRARRARRQSLAQDCLGGDRATPCEDIEASVQLAELVAATPEQDLQVLAVAADLVSPAEVAREKGKSGAALKQSVYRLRRALHEKYAALTHSPKKAGAAVALSLTAAAAARAAQSKLCTLGLQHRSIWPIAVLLLLVAAAMGAGGIASVRRTMRRTSLALLTRWDPTLAGFVCPLACMLVGVTLAFCTGVHDAWFAALPTALLLVPLYVGAQLALPAALSCFLDERRRASSRFADRISAEVSQVSLTPISRYGRDVTLWSVKLDPMQEQGWEALRAAFGDGCRRQGPGEIEIQAECGWLNWRQTFQQIVDCLESSEHSPRPESAYRRPPIHEPYVIPATLDLDAQPSLGS
jgi:DNA-directed RNA polymerase specialized sigma24 family protein